MGLLLATPPLDPFGALGFPFPGYWAQIPSSWALSCILPHYWWVYLLPLHQSLSKCCYLLSLYFQPRLFLYFHTTPISLLSISTDMFHRILQLTWQISVMSLIFTFKPTPYFPFKHDASDLGKWLHIHTAIWTKFLHWPPPISFTLMVSSYFSILWVPCEHDSYPPSLFISIWLPYLQSSLSVFPTVNKTFYLHPYFSS